jgi:hypothetical protein
MSRKIRYVKPAAGEKPAVRIEFKGAVLNDYFSLRKVARDDFGVTQTELGRKIICDWLKRYRAAVSGDEARVIRQMTLALGLEGDKLKGAGDAQKGKAND